MDKAHSPFPGGKYLNTNQLEWFRLELQQQLDECERLIEDTKSQDDQASPEGDEADVADYKIQIEQQASAIHRLHLQKEARHRNGLEPNRQRRLWLLRGNRR
jgi:hypothetical protein